MSVRHFLLITTLVIASQISLAQTTLFVTSTLDDGSPGTLREAIAIANSNSTFANPHRILFTGLSSGDRIDIDNVLQVSGDYITLNGDLNGDFIPDITIRSANIGFSGIQLLGTNCSVGYLNIIGFNTSGQAAIIVQGGNNSVIGNYIGTDLSGTVAASLINSRGISIEGGSGHFIGDGTPEGRNVIGNASIGLFMQGAGSNAVLGNYIGIGADGQTAITNLGPGIEMINSMGNQIGGPNPGDGNVISGNNQDGIVLSGNDFTLIEGNFIGTDASGTSTIPNGDAGISAGSGNKNTTIRSNLVSGNGKWGIEISNSSTDLIVSNTIGLDISGTLNLGNGNHGIWVGSASTGTTIGDGTALGRNFVSGNSGNGILLSGGTHQVLNNFVGTDVTGVNSIGNSGGGVVAAGGLNHQIGAIGQGNLISANVYGIGISVPGCFVIANKIGTNLAGDAPLSNLTSGIRLTGNAQSALIGDGTPAGSNLISGNLGDGVMLDGPSVNSNDINMNYIGSVLGGSGPLGNGGNGVTIEGNANTNNVRLNTITDNTEGIEINGSFAPSTFFNLVEQNSIFLNSGKGISIINGAQNGVLPPTITSNQQNGTLTGTAEPNAMVEIFIDSEDEGQQYVGAALADGSGNWSFVLTPSDIVIGLVNVTAVQKPNGNSSEFSSAQELLIAYTVVNTSDSGPGSLRWAIDNANSSLNASDILFDIPNTDPNYTNDAGNEYWTISPDTELPQIVAPIIIDGGTQAGSGPYKIRIDGRGIVGVGLDFSYGGNQVYGLSLKGFDTGGAQDAAINIVTTNNVPSIIGAPGRGNVIGGSRQGISINLVHGNTIQGNLIGTDETGMIANPISAIGISLSNSDDNIVGGSAAGAGNVISGSALGAITINVSPRQIITGNYIGTNVLGLNPLPNANGIRIGTSSGHEIRDNVISANNGYGIEFINVSNVIIQGNSIGVGSDGVTPLGNDVGIQGTGGLNVDNITIGGISSGEGNIIAHNANQGIFLNDDNHNFNTIIGNSIYCNGGLGIDLRLYDASTFHGNDGILAPTISSFTITAVSGIGNDGEIIHVYSDNSGCIPAQGAEYLGTTAVSSGTWMLTGVSLNVTDVITATATDGLGNTSQFSEPEISVFEGPNTSGNELIDDQSTEVDLGSAYFGQGISFPFTIENVGTRVLSIMDVASTNSEIQISGFPGSVAPGSSASFEVIVDGFTSGSFSGDILIQSDDFDEPLFTFPVTATIIPAAIMRVFIGPDQNGTEVIDGQGFPVYFGTTEVGNDLPLEFTITNEGDIDLDVSSITSATSEYTVSGAPFTVPPFGTFTFTCTLFQAPIGVHVGSIEIVGTDPLLPSFTIDVEGEITSPEMKLYAGSTTADPEITDFIVDIGTTPLGVDLMADITISNEGTAVLVISEIDVEETEFSLQNGPSTVDIASQATFQLILDGTTVGVFTTGITVTSNDFDRPVFYFMVRGEVLDRSLTIKEDSQSGTIIDENTPIDVGTTPPETTKEKVFVIENTSLSDLVVSSITVDNNVFEIVNIPAAIPPGSFSSFSVLFSTAIVGNYQGTVVITTNIGTFTFFVTGSTVDVEVFNALSPNGDGIHDYLKIENLEFYPNNSVHIYTRWGDKLFEIEGYNNSDKAFNGLANLGNYGDVPDGTYYYVIAFEYMRNDGSVYSDKLTGFFVLRR